MACLVWNRSEALNTRHGAMQWHAPYKVKYISLGVSMVQRWNWVRPPRSTMSRSFGSDPLYKLSESDPYWIKWDAKLRKTRYGSTTTDAMFIFVNHAQFLQWCFLAASAWRATSLILCIHMHATTTIYNLHRTTPINPLLLQDSKSATLAICQGTLFYKARAAAL